VAPCSALVLVILPTLPLPVPVLVARFSNFKCEREMRSTQSSNSWFVQPSPSMAKDWRDRRQEDDVVASWQHFNHACGLTPVDRISMVHKAALVEDLLRLRPKIGIDGWLLLVLLLSEMFLVIVVVVGRDDVVVAFVVVVVVVVGLVVVVARLRGGELPGGANKE